jgi:4-hydroxybenzoate polyprenyltransferase
VRPDRLRGTTSSAVTRPFVIVALLALRPKQWTKNALVFAALVFDLKLFDVDRLLLTIGAFVCFCLASSSIYLVNDMQDVASDRLHPVKRHRPIPAGEISLKQARLMVVGLVGVCLPGAYLLAPEFAGAVAGYLILMAAYTVWLKHFVILDVFAISGGFVLRAAGGALVLDVPISPWLYVCTVLLSLFLGFGKRRHELQLLEGSASSHRRNLEEYSIELLDQMILITASATVMAYSLYSFTAASLPGNHSMMLTIPFVVYAIFRYLFLIHRRDGGGSPEQLLLSDGPLLAGIVLWGIVAVGILYTMG